MIMSFAASPVGTIVHSTEMAEVVRAKTDLSVLIPALHEGPNLAILLPWLNRILDELRVSHEVIVITKQDDSETISAAAVGGAEVLAQVSNGYGGALIDGLKRSRGEFVLTLDADLSHRPDFIRRMWDSRYAADITIASRYVPGGTATMPKARLYLSRVLNLVFRRGLSVPVLDLSSGFRLYRRSCIDPDGLSGADFDVLEEILVKAFCDGWRVQEIPFDYMPPRAGYLSGSCGTPRTRLLACVLGSVEVAQLDCGGRLRLPRLRQPNPFAALLAKIALSHRQRAG